MPTKAKRSPRSKKIDRKMGTLLDAKVPFVRKYVTEK
jgi:hypothetical protein